MKLGLVIKKNGVSMSKILNCITALMVFFLTLFKLFDMIGLFNIHNSSLLKLLMKAYENIHEIYTQFLIKAVLIFSKKKVEESGLDRRKVLF